jgi:hypothetical protein
VRLDEGVLDDLFGLRWIVKKQGGEADQVPPVVTVQVSQFGRSLQAHLPR